MITALNIFTYTYEIIINFFAHSMIFLGCFYVALHNRKMPQWHVTPIWYTGLFSFLTCLTIIFQWSIGPEFPLSYFNLGKLTETLVNVSLASLATIMLIGTLRKDIVSKKYRTKNTE